MTLQTIWYVLIGVLLAGYAVLDGFDLGVGILYPVLARDESERKALRHAIGPVWDGNEVWLLTGGGALFAAFPAVYATVFSGLYLALMLVLFGLIFRAVSLEFRARDEAWATVWDRAFVFGSALPALLFGVAVGNMVRGIPLDAGGLYAGTFFTLLNPYALLIGVLGFVMIISHGAAWAALKTTGDLQRRAAKARSHAHWTFTALLGVATLVTAIALPDTFGRVITSVAGWAMVAALVAGLIWARLAMNRGSDTGAFAGSGLGILGLVGLWFAGNFPALVPDVAATARSLTIYNASSSALTLTVMLVIAIIGVPLVLGYTYLVYRIFGGKVHEEDVGY